MLSSITYPFLARFQFRDGRHRLSRQSCRIWSRSIGPTVEDAVARFSASPLTISPVGITIVLFSLETVVVRVAADAGHIATAASSANAILPVDICCPPSLIRSLRDFNFVTVGTDHQDNLVGFGLARLGQRLKIPAMAYDVRESRAHSRPGDVINRQA